MAFLDETGLAEVWSLVKARVVTYEATVTTSWNDSSGILYQDIAIPGILATDNPIVDINPTDTAGYGDVKLYSEAMCKVYRIRTYDGKVRIAVTDKPAIAFPIQLKVVR